MKTIRDVVLILCVWGALATNAVAQPKTIDDFTTPQSTTGVVDGAGILGGERDAALSGGQTLDISGGTASITRPEDTGVPFTILYWDGDDDTVSVNFTLGPVDFTNGGTNDRFYIRISELTGTVRLWISIANSLEIQSHVEINVAETGYVQIPFDSLIPASGPSATDRTAVDILTLRFVLDVGESVSMDRFLVGPDPLLFEDGFELVDP